MKRPPWARNNPPPTLHPSLLSRPDLPLLSHAYLHLYTRLQSVLVNQRKFAFENTRGSRNWGASQRSPSLSAPFQQRQQEREDPTGGGEARRKGGEEDGAGGIGTQGKERVTAGHVWGILEQFLEGGGLQETGRKQLKQSKDAWHLYFL